MKICHIEKLTSLKHLNLFSINYRDRVDAEKNGFLHPDLFWMILFSQTQSLPDAVVVVPFHVDQEKLVIIREFRVVLGDYQYGFPAGLVDNGENIEQAAKRELFEETGLNITKIMRQSPCVYSSSGMTDESVALLFAECDGIASTRFNEDSEEIEVVMLSRKKAEQLLADPNIKFDVKTWIVLNTFACHGII